MSDGHFCNMCSVFYALLAHIKFKRQEYTLRLNTLISNYYIGFDIELAKEISNKTNVYCTMYSLHSILI